MRVAKIGIILVVLLLTACTNTFNKQNIIANDTDSLGLQNIALGRVDGLTDDALIKLHQAVMSYAKSYGFALDTKAQDLILQGYFSFEANEQNNQIVYYVFDLLDKKGQRLHRVNGRLFLANNKDTILQDEDYKEIASQLFLQLRQWRSRLNK